VRDVERAVRETERCRQHELTTCAVLLGTYLAETAQPQDPSRGKQLLLQAHDKGDRFATKILAQLDYFGDSDDSQAQPLLELLAETDAEAALWLARLDAHAEHSVAARERLLKLRERFPAAANWLLGRWCGSACPHDMPGGDPLVADTKARLASEHGDDLQSSQSQLWEDVDLLAADPRSDRDDGAFALRIARLLPLANPFADGNPARNLETLAAAQARAGEFSVACTTQTNAVAQIAQQTRAPDNEDILHLAQARVQAYCAGKPWNQRVYGTGHLFAENLGS
jgi:hypothetical protein